MVIGKLLEDKVLAGGADFFSIEPLEMSLYLGAHVAPIYLQLMCHFVSNKPKMRYFWRSLNVAFVVDIGAEVE